MKPISDARTCKDGCTYLQGRMHVLARTDARTCKDGCTYLRERLQILAWRMQCTARTDAVHCRGGCSALRERLQCTASEMENTGTEKASPILDKKLGRKDGSSRDTLGLPQDISAKPHYHHPSVFTMAFLTHTIPSPVSFQYHCGTNQKTLQYQ